ncbi:MAG: ACP phosphodiesterase [Ectothiorhodospiraceae bacterium]|jgi:acyl carrier protein phosphodiesterase
MNFLAHLRVAGEDDTFRVGNLMGDFVKGRPEDRYREALARGVRLHRAVDSFSDAHPMHLRSRRRFRGPRRRVAGIAVDLAYDHYLARHWTRFSDEPLGQFTQRAYHALYRHHDELPERLQRLLPLMSGDDWLQSYVDLENVATALERMSRRLSRPNALAASTQEIRANYGALEADFLAFFPQLLEFTADWRRRNPPPRR